MLALVAVVLVAGLGLRAGYLGVVRGGELSDRAVGQQRSATEALAPRGAIVTRDGHDLARDQLAVEVTGTPALVTDARGTAARLAPLLGVEEEVLAERLDGNGGYARLARAIAPDKAAEVADLDIPGIHFSDTYERVLPRGSVAAQIVGLTNEERTGAAGLEASLDDALTGTPGSRVEARDPFGRRLDTIVDEEPVPGEQVRLTLDGVIQDRTERILAETREEFGAKSAMAVVMRPDDGAILAMASVPRPNPARRTTYSPELWRNKAVTDTFEPGSTFKIVTVAGALEEGLVQPETRFDLPATLTLYDRELGESHRDYDTNLTTTEILEQSSNVGTVKIGQRLGQAGLQKWISRFGFGESTGIDYPGEVPGIVLPSEEWSGVSILNIPIGQGVGVTLTQLVRAYAVIANGGRLVTPHLVSRVGDRDTGQRAAPRVLTAQTASEVDRMLRKVVSPDGTGEAAEIEGYEVAGKTGTANKIDPNTGEYDARYVASFVGYVPADKPELLVAVVVDEPSGAYYGGAVAAPAFEQIGRFSLQYLGIAP